jgi:hypothetical protein
MKCQLDERIQFDPDFYYTPEEMKEDQRIATAFEEIRRALEE